MNGNNPEPAVINPRRLPGDPELGPLAILALVPADLKLFSRLSQPQAKPVEVREYFKLFDLGGGLSLAGPAIGAPQAVLVAEKLFALGVQQLLVQGWAGSLTPGARLGDHILVTGSLSEEGTSSHYPLDREAGPDQKLNQALETSAADLGLEIKSGTVWSIDAPFRETKSKVTAYAQQGLMAVEMELSALFTVAAFRGRGAAALVVVTDELFGADWRPGFASDQVKASRRRAAQVVLNAAAKLI